MIAVCLLTCDRAEYTERTLRSFAAQNDTSRFRLLHADDASTDDRVPALAHTYGFQTVARSETRRGWLPMRIALFEEAARRGSEWVIFLENDIEWLRTFPWPLFDYVSRLANIYCLRLHGQYKGRPGEEPCLAFHKQGPRLKPVKWRRLKHAPEPAQVGVIHWSAQPSVTRVDPLLEIHRHGMESGDLTARVLENVTVHIGAQRTAPAPVTPRQEATC